MVWLPDGEKKTLTMCLAVSREYQRVTDRRTDILPQHSPRYAYASCGNNRLTEKRQRTICLQINTIYITAVVCVGAED